MFLVRESTNYPGDYTLCVSCDGKVEHYRIIYHNGKLTIDEEEYFENLMQLVEVRNYRERGIKNSYISFFFKALDTHNTLGSQSGS